MNDLIPHERIIDKIIVLRGKNVMLDRDLAEMYGVKTKVLKQSVRRNIERFPEDFMFELSDEEYENWRSQFVTSNSTDRMGLRYKPMTFTEHGILMLSSVLRSPQAIQVNIAIIRVFNRMREMLESNQMLYQKLQELEQGIIGNNEEITHLWFELKKLIELDQDSDEERIGFKIKD